MSPKPTFPSTTGVKIYSIEEFSSVMALQEIANTVEAAAEQGPKAKLK